MINAILQPFRRFMSQLILQPFRHFTYVTTHSTTLPLLYLRHSSFSNPCFASPTSQALHLIHLASRQCCKVRKHCVSDQKTGMKRFSCTECGNSSECGKNFPHWLSACLHINTPTEQHFHNWTALCINRL